MKVRYSSHAVDRMFQRNVTTTDVELILNEPDGNIRQSIDKSIYYKKLRGRKDNLIATVVVNRNFDLLEVITVMIHFEVKK